MKKLFLVASAALAIAAVTACSGNKKVATDDAADSAVTTEKTAYTGVLPGADCDGIWYTLQLNDGKYDMIETYFALDTTATVGIDAILSVKSEGTYSTVEKDGASYLQLTPDINDSAAQAFYFAYGDSTLTMVNADYEAPSTPDYYTLNQVK